MSGMSGGEPFSHILCWVDGSDEGCRAAEHAAYLARSLGAKLSYLAVGTETGRDKGFDEYARIEGVSEPMPPVLKGDVDACLRQAMSIAAKIGIAGTARLVRSGDEVMAVCDAAQAQDADLVVIRKRRSRLVEPLRGAA
ncbi:MAG: universal stress protein, partial [Roseovarius sp.]|nr:universal stress protein [Roseovarius sp.]